MLDQSFSYENFRTILDLENRKGLHVEDKLSITSVRKINEDIRECNKNIKIKRKEGDTEALITLYEDKKLLREQKEIELEKVLEEISGNVSNKSFNISLNQIKIPGGKDIYTVPDKAEHFFAIKQVQRNIEKLFGVKQSNRHSIVEQILLLLGNDFPKFVIRTDIKDFYENIDHDTLTQIVLKDNLLSPLSRKIFQSILKSYKIKSGSNKGIPRGIGVSAYLGELYLRDIDTDIKELKGVTYYSRYVDDILIIFTPSPIENTRNYLDEIKELVEKRHKSRLNSTKTDSFDLRNMTRSTYKLEYLGYKISFGNSKVKTELTDKKILKYRERIKSSFDDYINYSKINEKSARNILVKRIRFLTGNTRLANNKKNILVGIYYSNRHLTEVNQLVGIDKYLLWYINHKISSINLKERLKKYSFLKGFEERRFSPFKANELKEIMSIWKKHF